MWYKLTEADKNNLTFDPNTRLKVSYEISRENGSYVNKFQNRIESYRNGVLQVYTIEPSRIIRELRKIRKNRTSKLGRFDFETYTDFENIAVPYSCVTKIKIIDTVKNRKVYKDKIESFYLDEFNSSLDLVKRVIDEICHHDKSYWYAHNMGRFDGVFIVHALCEMNLDFEVLWNGNSILSINIVHPKYGTKVTIRDSKALLKGSLSELGKAFANVILKDKFPHKFASLANINYIGKEPDDSFYTNGNKSDGLDNWDFKAKSLEYNMKDTLLLYDIIQRFSISLWEDFHIDMVSVQTVASLAISVYLSSFYDSVNKPIHHISRNLESLIREAYFGGICTVFKDHMDDCYYYDMTSQYPAAMLSDMPIGKPVAIANLEHYDIEKFFGFAYCEIEAPSYDVLPNLTLPRRVIINNREEVQLSRGKWTGWYFSEEIKDAIKYGYKVKLLSGVKFNRGKDVFTSYVNHFFKIKREETGVKKIFAKLMLNCLYGKWGMKERVEKMIVIRNGSYNELDVNTRFIQKINESYDLVSHRGKYNDELIKALKNSDLVDESKGSSHAYGFYIC